MNEESFYIGTLARKLVTGQLTSRESTDLEEWMAVYPWRREMIERVIEQEKIIAGLAGFGQFNEDEMRSRIVSYFDVAGYSPSTQEQAQVNPGLNVSRPMHRIHFLKTAWVRYAAAILILFGVGIYFYTSSRKPTITGTSSTLVKNDVLPGNDKATLTLSNGQTIQLNGDTSETIKDKTLLIENKNGQLIYKQGDMVVMNTMTTPKGGQYKLTLPDGTAVWLNAASSITYPTAFTGNSRQVAIIGEAYFEVTKDKSKPFQVKTATEVVEVLGTSFNVNAYPDEAHAKTTLVEGAVKINDKILKPGEAFIAGKITKTNVSQDVAWKNGAFNFNGLELTAALRQLSRWYDVTIVFEGNIPKKEFYGEMGRNLNLSEVLRVLKGLDIQTRLEGRTLYILSEKN